MSRASRQKLAAPPEEAATPPAPEAPSKSVSVPVGTMRLSGVVKTTNGFAVASVELTRDEWELISSKRLGRSQAWPNFVADEHRKVVSTFGQLVQREGWRP